MTDNSTQSKGNKIEARLSLLEYQFQAQGKQLDRIELAVNSATKQIDTLKYVSIHEYEENRKDDAKTYVTNDSIKSMRTLFWAIIISCITGLIGLGFFIIQSLIQKK